MSDNPHEERRQEITPAVRSCPICDGPMDVVYNRNNQQVLVCTECHSGLTVPANAWEVARTKRDAR